MKTLSLKCIAAVIALSAAMALPSDRARAGGYYHGGGSVAAGVFIGLATGVAIGALASRPYYGRGYYHRPYYGGYYGGHRPYYRKHYRRSYYGGHYGRYGGTVGVGIYSRPRYPRYYDRSRVTYDRRRVAYTSRHPVKRGRYQPWTKQWHAYCRAKYRSFNPRTGTYRTYRGTDRFCR